MHDQWYYCSLMNLCLTGYKKLYHTTTSVIHAVMNKTFTLKFK